MRIARRLLHGLLIVVILIIGATAAAVVVAETAWFKNWLRGYIVREANQYLNGNLTIGRLGGNLFFGVELENIGLSMDGSEVVAVKDLGLNYNVFEMVAKGLSVDQIRLNHPVIYLRRDGDSWAISRLIKKQEQEADRSGPASPIAINKIGISDASIVVPDPVGTSGVNVPKRVDHLDATLSFKYEPVRYSIQISHVSFRSSEPSIGLNALSGGVSVKDDTLYIDKLALRTEETSLSIDGAIQQYLTTPKLNLQISSDKVSLHELAPLVPSLAGIDLQPSFDLKLGGPLDRLGIEMDVQSSAGSLNGKLQVDAVAPGQSVAGDVSIRNLDLAPILRDPAKRSDLTANASLNLRMDDMARLQSLKGTASIESPRVAVGGYAVEDVAATAHVEGRRVAINGRASAYGAAFTVGGRVVLPSGADAISYDVSGKARHVDLAKLPKQLNGEWPQLRFRATREQD